MDNQSNLREEDLSFNEKLDALLDNLDFYTNEELQEYIHKLSDLQETNNGERKDFLQLIENILITKIGENLKMENEANESSKSNDVSVEFDNSNYQSNDGKSTRPSSELGDADSELNLSIIQEKNNSKNKEFNDILDNTDNLLITDNNEFSIFNTKNFQEVPKNKEINQDLKDLHLGENQFLYNDQVEEMFKEKCPNEKLITLEIKNDNYQPLTQAFENFKKDNTISNIAVCQNHHWYAVKFYHQNGQYSYTIADSFAQREGGNEGAKNRQAEIEEALEGVKRNEYTPLVQNDSYNCGIHVANNLACMQDINNKKSNFTESDIQKDRKNIDEKVKDFMKSMEPNINVEKLNESDKKNKSNLGIEISNVYNSREFGKSNNFLPTNNNSFVLGH